MRTDLAVGLLRAPVRGRSFCECVVASSSSGEGCSACCLYRDHIARRDPWTIYESDLQTEELTAYEGQKADPWFLFAMPDGCIYTFPEDLKHPGVEGLCGSPRSQPRRAADIRPRLAR